MSTVEWVSHSDESDNFVLARLVLAYRQAAKRVCGNVLEIGTGFQYGEMGIRHEVARYYKQGYRKCF